MLFKSAESKILSPINFLSNKAAKNYIHLWRELSNALPNGIKLHTEIMDGVQEIVTWILTHHTLAPGVKCPHSGVILQRGCVCVCVCVYGGGGSVDRGLGGGGQRGMVRQGLVNRCIQSTQSKNTAQHNLDLNDPGA